MRALAMLGAILFCEAELPARESCPVEVKLLLSSQATEAAIGSLGLAKKTTGRVYFFDTDALDLFKQGVILRVREDANNDITVKVRQPEGGGQIHYSRMAGVPCEIDQTGDGAHALAPPERQALGEALARCVDETVAGPLEGRYVIA